MIELGDWFNSDGRAEHPESGFGGHHTQLLTEALRVGYARFMARLARVIVPGLPHHITQRATVASRHSFATRITSAT